MTLPDFERKSRAQDPPDFHLKRMQLLMESCGNPQNAVPAIHVAGSKGKGSTAAMITSILAAAGHTVGLYTSPSLHAARERIRVSLEPIAEDTFADLVDELWPHIVKLSSGDVGKVSYFEIMTSMAWVHFAAIGADFQVVEVGLGGRLDATNLLNPLVSVITPIGLDHVAVLGNTIPEIAAEKGGIIKPDTPVVIGRQPTAAMTTLATIADSRGAPLVNAIGAIEAHRLPSSNDTAHTTQFTSSVSGNSYSSAVPLFGRHQIDNARVAVAAVEQLPAASRPYADAIERGLTNVKWPARAEILPSSDDAPVILVDGAHTPDSAQVLADAIADLALPSDHCVVVFGGSGGHDFAETAARLANDNTKFIVTQSRHPKSVPPDEVAEALLRDNVEVALVTANTTEALAAAKQLANKDDLIVATGSLAIAAEIRELELNIQPDYYPTLRLPAADRK
jgi:dihydrofolate synthase/folylpolyglutamate synthase